MMWFPLAALWGAVWWRLRGGAFTALPGLDPGTGGMRAIAAAGLPTGGGGPSLHGLVAIPYRSQQTFTLAPNLWYTAFAASAVSIQVTPGNGI